MKSPMGLLDAVDQKIEATVGVKRNPMDATCCGNCTENIRRPPNVCRMLDTPGLLPSWKAIIKDQYSKLDDCPYTLEKE